MKPFDPTLPVQTRDGKKARIICTDRANSRPIVALVTSSDGKEYPQSYFPSGLAHDYPGHSESPSDLVNVPVKHKRWVNIYYYGGWTHHSRQEADECAIGSRLACIEIEFTEGQGLEDKS